MTAAPAKLFPLFNRPSTPASAPSRKIAHSIDREHASAPARLRGRPRLASKLGKDDASRRLSKGERTHPHPDIVDMTVDLPVQKRVNWGRGEQKAIMDQALIHYSKTGNVKATARLFGVPRTVLIRRVRLGRSDVQSGPKPALPAEIEQQVAAHVLAIADIGHGLGDYSLCRRLPLCHRVFV